MPRCEYPVNFDVWWFRLQRDGAAEFSFLPRVAPGKALGVIPREGYDQIAYLGPKGTDSQLRARGIEAFRRDVSALLSEATESVATLTSMDDIRHLDVRVDRLRRWHADGLLCIGDAAHAMSPLGGVGINLAIHRKNPVLRIKEGDTYVAVASNAGATSHPSWYRNLITHRPGPPERVASRKLGMIFRRGIGRWLGLQNIGSTYDVTLNRSRRWGWGTSPKLEAADEPAFEQWCCRAGSRITRDKN